MSLLDRTLASLPEQVAAVVIVGAVREVARPVVFTSEDPPGGGPAAALVAGLRRALEESSDAIVHTARRMHRSAVRLRALCSAAWRASQTPKRLSASMPAVASSRFSSPYAGPRPRRWWQPPDRAAQPGCRRAGCSMRYDLVWSLTSCGQPSFGTSTRLINCSPGSCRSSAAVSSILELAAERRKAVDRPVVIAIDGPSCSGKSILAAAVALRSGASVLEGDDFYRDTLPNLTVAQREAMSDAAVVDAVIDWARLRDQALLPLRAGESATFQPYDWDADDGRLAPPKTIPAADVIIVDGVYAARPELADLVDLAVYLGVDPQTRANRYPARNEDPDWQRFWERGEAHYFSAVRPPASFDIQLDDQDLGDRAALDRAYGANYGGGFFHASALSTTRLRTAALASSVEIQPARMSLNPTQRVLRGKS